MDYAIPQRLDRLPMSRELWRVLILAGLAWLIESYDIGVIGAILPSVKQDFGLGSSGQGLVAIASTLGIVVAVIPSGWLADQIGRKRMLMIGTAWYAIFTALTAIAPSAGALIGLRFLAGLGMGMVFPIPYAIAAEYVSHRLRGAATGWLDACLSVGYFLAPLLAFVILPSFSLDGGWRVLCLIGGLPLLYVPLVARWMPESARWLVVRGRDEEADRVVRYFEEAVEQRTGTALPSPRDETAVKPEVGRSSPLLLFSRGYLRRTAMMWIAFPCLLFVFYAVQTYTPTVLLKEGFGHNAFLITALIVLVSIPGKFTEAWAVERYGRKATILAFGIISALSAVLFAFAQLAAIIIFGGMLLSFFGIGVDPAIKIYGAEQYPTRIRETGVGFIEGVGRLVGGALAPYIMSLALAGGIAGSYLFVAGVALVGVLAVAVLGTETGGRSLERAARIDVSPDWEAKAASRMVS